MAARSEFADRGRGSPAPAAPPPQPVFELSTSPHFAAWLAAERASLVFTTYQTAKVFFIGLQPNGRLSIFERTLERVMGLSARAMPNSTDRALGRAEDLMAGEADPPPHRPRHAASPTSPPDGRRGASGAGSPIPSRFARIARESEGSRSASTSTLWLSTLYQMWRFENALSPAETFSGYDAVYTPRESHVTGELDVHDIAVDDAGGVVFSNTLFNCVATLDAHHSFRPVWQPPWIAKLVPEDHIAT